MYMYIQYAYIIILEFEALCIIIPYTLSCWISTAVAYMYFSNVILY